MTLRLKAAARTCLAAWLGAALLAGCGSIPIEPATEDDLNNPRRPKDRESVFGPGGIQLFGNDKDGDQRQTGGIGVNSFLWRASLDTLAFMPLASADPFGGVIITDWYSPPESPETRFKVTVFILDRQLRVDGLRVSVFRQRREPGGDWTDAPVADTTARAMEDAILTDARQMRIAAIEQ